MIIGVEPGLHESGGVDLRGIVVTFSDSLGACRTPGWLVELFQPEVPSLSLVRSEDTRKKIRDLLRGGGYKPTGRGKPSSEYLVRAAEEGFLKSINVAVDAINAVSLHSGIPISIIDLDRAQEPFRIARPEPGTSYVFNPAGQTIDIGGLLSLFDAEGPCANAVKDSQRTKTHEATRRMLTILWGSRDLEEGLMDQATDTYTGIVARLGGSCDEVTFER